MDKRILVVDDSQSIRIVIRSVLEEQGYQVEEAENGRVALELLQADGDFRMILTDVNMPEMDGIKFVNEAKKLDSMKFIPFCILTSEHTAEMKQKGKDAGAKAWLVKPFEPDKLIKVMKRLVG
jgi:two-component system chemotaxis response regulator CheY